MSTSDNYIGTYKVVKLFRKSNRRHVLHINLTREGAMKIVNSCPSNKHHMVVFVKQFWADKWFIKKEISEL